MGSAAESLMKDPRFQLRQILNKAYTRFTTEFAKDFPFKLVDNAPITRNPAYQAYQSNFLADTSKAYNKLAGVQYVVENGFIWAEWCGPLVRDKTETKSIYIIY
jgi:hypothetical protein